MGDEDVNLKQIYGRSPESMHRRLSDQEEDHKARMQKRWEIKKLWRLADGCGLKEQSRLPTSIHAD